MTRNVGGLTRIWIVDVETQEARKLTRGAVENPQRGPAWSPSGDLIAFGETAGLALARPDGGGYRQLRPGPQLFERSDEAVGDRVTYAQPTWCRG